MGDRVLKPFKAVLLDQDQTLTRSIGPDAFLHASYQAHVACLKLQDRAHHAVTEDEMAALLQQYLDGPGLLKSFARHFAIDEAALLHHFRQVDVSHLILHDTASASILNSLSDRILLFTDAPRHWAQDRADMIGHQLAIQSAEDTERRTGDYEVKARGGPRWGEAVEVLRDSTGDPTLQPGDVLVIDDHAPVLAAARAFGMLTGQCTFGYSDRAFDPQWGFHIKQVGAFLVRSGFHHRHARPAPAEPTRTRSNAWQLLNP